MGTINDYLSGIQGKYPDTQAVREQIEELRDTLHLKTEDLQARGKTYEEASSEAIKELGDITPLLDQVSGNIRNVYINLLKRDDARFCILIIFAEYLLGWLGFLLFADQPGFVYCSGFVITTLFLVIFLSIWPIISHFIYKKSPLKIEVVQMPYKKAMNTALLCWLIISILMFIFNFFTGPTVWFIWPIIGVSNWPINIYIYHRLLISGRYDAPTESAGF